MTIWRRKIAEYEASLYRIPGSSFLSFLFDFLLDSLGFRSRSGEVDIKIYGDGEKVMEVELYNVNALDGSAVSVVINDTPICKVKVNQGRGYLLWSTARGETVPEVNVGDVIEIHDEQGEILLRGTFKPD